MGKTGKKAAKSKTVERQKTVRKSSSAGKKSAPKKVVVKAVKTDEQLIAEKQALAMWGLLGAGGEAYGGNVRPEIRKAEREALEQAGLVEVSKVKRAYRLTVTDRGWHWAETHLADPLPENVAGAAVLQAWLARLHGFLRARDIPLSELFMEPLAHIARISVDQKSSDAGELREQIRAAYLEIGGGLNRRVLLRDLRARLSGIDRSLLDSELMQMLRDEEASLMQLDYRPDVSDEDHSAALKIGNEPRHIIWISK